MTIFFWIIFFIIFYTYIGFPLTLLVLSAFRKESDSPKTEYSPTISMIIPVHNEESIIEEKLKNSLSLDYPKDRLRIIVASDNSTDRTNQIVAAYKDANPSLDFFSYGKRSGKLATLIEAVGRAEGEIIVLTDADAVLEKDALINIVKPFAAKSVGAVSANVEYFMPAKSLKGRNFYWNIENFIRSLEAGSGSLCLSTGPFWAIRKGLFYQEAPLYAIDDAVLPMYVVRRGYRVAVCKDARANILPHPSAKTDFMGIKRAVNGGFWAIIHHKVLLNFLKYPVISFCLLWHKIMRWLTFFFIAVLFLSNLALLGNNIYFYKFTFACQCLFYIMALAGFMIPKSRKIIIFQMPFYLVCNWIAIFIGFFEVILNKKVITWQSFRV